MSTAPVAPAFASVGEAMDMARAALGYLAAADATQLAAETQAECLRTLERTDAISHRGAGVVPVGVHRGQGVLGRCGLQRAVVADAPDRDHPRRRGQPYRMGQAGRYPSRRSWRRWPAEEMSESYARAICQWTDRLPEKYREESDELLVKAAAAGLGLADLSALFAEMYERARSDLPDEDPARAFGDRGVRLETTFQGAGVLNGDLTPECAAVVGKVLDALSAPAGAEDDRTQEQRYHDALAEAMRRLVASGMLPERAGQPVKVWAHISLADLLRLDGDSALQEQWTAQVRARWAAHRAAASEDRRGRRRLAGRGRRRGASRATRRWRPIVTGDVNVDALEDLVRLCVELDARRDGARDAAWAALEQAVIGKAVDLLSGPGGLASFLRRRQLGARLAGPSLPLDIGYAETIPAGIRNAVILRDKHCQWAGRCDQPAEACQVHHTKHKANGGPTSVTDCVLLCWFHHQVVIHRWGWTLVLNPDGTTTAWNKDKTKVLHSHGPPVRPG